MNSEMLALESGECPYFPQKSQ